MPKYRVRFNVEVEVAVDLEAPDEESAFEAAWRPAEDYLQTLTPQRHGDARVSAEATLDGIAGDTAEEITP